MSSPLRPTTFSSASPSQTGATRQNPLLSAGVRAHPNDERFYVLDRAQGFLQVIAREAQDYSEIGYPVFDGFGNRVAQFDAAHNAAIIRHAEADQADAFYSQLDDIWEIIDMRQAMADAASDETVHYNFETRRWYKKKKAKGTPNGILKKDEKPGPGSPGAGAAASGASSLTT